MVSCNIVSNHILNFVQIYKKTPLLHKKFVMGGLSSLNISEFNFIMFKDKNKHKTGRQ